MKIVIYLALLATVVASKQHLQKDQHNVKGATRPNIVLFFVDDMGYGDLSVYGNPTTFAPNIQRMARNGLLFTNMYSPSPVCCPSRAAVLTGRHQIRSGIYPEGIDPSDLGGLPHEEYTIAEGLRDVGYTTGMLGKWHLGVGYNGSNLPIYHGFDYYFGIPYTHDACPCTKCFYPDGECYQNPHTPSTCHSASDYVGCPLMENDDIVQQPVDLTTLNYYMTRAGVNFIKKSATSSSKKPFFLYFAFHHTHWPQFAGKRFRNASIAGPFGDTVREIDWSVGQVFRALSDLNIDNNTLVVFTADNGPDLEQEEYGGSAGPFRCGKTSTWEGGFRVPAIFWWPNHVIVGRTTKLAAGYDLLPTFFKIAGANVPENRTMDGYDMTPILYYKQESGREMIPYFPEDADPEIGPYAIRWRNYKAHFYTKGGNAPPNHFDELCRNTTGLQQRDPPLLYNLWTDPGERDPLDPDENYSLIQIMKQVRDDFVATLEWHTPASDAGEDPAAQPCAVPGCSPWPTCCQINLLSSHHSVTDDHSNLL